MLLSFVGHKAKWLAEQSKAKYTLLYKTDGVNLIANILMTDMSRSGQCAAHGPHLD